MELSSCSFALFSFFLLLSYCLGLKSPLCHKEEESALLQFKQSFTLDLSDSNCLGALPILPSWKIEGSNGSCCSWDGIECDHDTGYVIGLAVSHSCLFGSIDCNSSLFRLVHLQKLSLSYNNFNYSKIPEAIGQFLELRYLDLSHSQFSGQIPYAISKLHKLSILDLSWNIDLNSKNPLLKLRNPDLRNLILNLTSLEELHLSRVNISSVVPNFLANFSSLKFLYMGGCGLQGNFPERLFQLRNLEHVILLRNPNLYGRLPEFNTRNSLQVLGLSFTGFYGRLPSTIGNLISLTTLFIDECNFSGTIPFSLGNLTKLKTLGLSRNEFSGQIPSSLQNLAKLNYLGLGYNDFNDTTSLPWLGKLYKLKVLGLSTMNLRYNVLPSIQNLSSLMFLNLNNNSMTGMLPTWLGNFSTSIKLLGLKNNLFRGSIPDSFINQNSLWSIDLSNNQLQGKLPRSFSSCKMLEALVLSNNQLNDVFPSWLATLPNLRVLILSNNQFHGDIREPKTNFEFSKLHIIDLSSNNFYGNFPFKYMSNWNAMKTFFSFSTYFSMNTSIPLGIESQPFMFSYPITIINKGSHRYFERILEAFEIIDLSCNRFEGEIPYSIGDLKGLQSLNLSFNKFTGQIPSSLENMKQLEVLDLSHNKLSGNIPQQLSHLTFLEIFNVSYNNLSGPVPHGPQLDNMNNNSYVGNSYLCGKPLSRECDQLSKAEEMPFQISEEEEEDQKSIFKCGWQIVLIGYGCGVVLGMVLGNCVFTQKQDWILKTLE